MRDVRLDFLDQLAYPALRGLTPVAARLRHAIRFPLRRRHQDVKSRAVETFFDVNAGDVAREDERIPGVVALDETVREAGDHVQSVRAG